MLKEIRSLKNFGAFDAYTWSTLPNMRPFSKFNLIYGWNYSGKTTISRAFDCIRQGKLAAPFEKSTIHFVRHDATFITNQLLESDPNIRVFNVDYVDRNLRWHQPNEGLEPVILLGEENLTLQTRLDEISVNIPKQQSELRAVSEKHSILDKTLNLRLTEESKNIKQKFWADRIEAYERPRLVKALTELKQNRATTPLSDEEYTKETTKLASRPLQALNKFSLPEGILSLPTIHNNLFSKTPAGKVITQLQNNSELNLWAKRGWELHKHEAGEKCTFCGNQITLARIDELDNHFSKEYQKQLDELLAIKTCYVSARDRLSQAKTLSFNSRNFYQHLELNADTQIIALQANITREKDRIDSIISFLNEKEKNLFNNLSFSNIPTSSDSDLKSSINQLNNIVQEHNAYTEELSKTRESARQVLTNNAVINIAESTGYFDVLDQLFALTLERTQIAASITLLQNEQRELLAKLDQSTKGAEAINSYLARYFGKNELRIEPNEQKRLDVLRASKKAIHLSEGEKTAISFAHFIAAIEERGARIEDAIVFIDDPVSSLDSNHLFGVFSLIESKLQNCKQLFISTHNHDFFDLLLDWRKNKNQNLREDTSAYLVRRLNGNPDSPSDFAPLPAELIKFRSEYVYLFSLIYKCAHDPVQGGQLLTLPNAMRRFLEAYIRFKFLSFSEKDKWDKCFGESAERVRNYVHSGSHENAMRSTKIPDKQEAVEISKLIIKMLGSTDSTHLDGLVNMVST